MVQILVIWILAVGVLLIPLTLVPHTYKLILWRRYPSFPYIRFKSAVWGLALLVSQIWEIIKRIDIFYNDRNWFGDISDRGGVDAIIYGGILVAIIINTAVYYIVVWRKREDDYTGGHQ